jgi:hypothetical protein
MRRRRGNGQWEEERFFFFFKVVMAEHSTADCTKENRPRRMRATDEVDTGKMKYCKNLGRKNL